MYRKIYPFLPSILIILIIFVLSQRIDPEIVELWIKQAGVYGPLVFITFSLIANIFAPLSGTPAMVAGFYLYGHNVIFLLTISGIISHVINFWIARKLGRPAVEKMVGKENLKKIDTYTKDHGFTSLLLMRIFLGGLHDFISYAMGLTNITFLQYITASFIAVIPGTIVWYLLTLKAQNPVSFTIVNLLIAAIFTVIYIAITSLRKRLRTNVR